jgi:DNA-binding Lrp family transcriptional regulator
VDTQVLVDSIMRQATVLIAQLSSAAGVRAPLAHLADEVFLNLSEELERQGVSRKVVADMFGLALRGYQRRVQRLRESATERGTTLWRALLEHVQEHGPLTRRRLFERFRNDDPLAVGAVLNDLSSSGLVYRTGSGDDTVYGVVRDEDRKVLAHESTLETSSALVWLGLCRDATRSVDDLASELSLTPAQVEAAITYLEDQGRIRREAGHIEVEPMVVPVGATEGWEAAVFDHFQAMCVAIATKLRLGRTRAETADTTGGATLAFEIHANHPQREEVLGLLARVRAEVNELWGRVEAHNAAHPVGEPEHRRVTFYFGQLEWPSEADEA